MATVQSDLQLTNVLMLHIQLLKFLKHCSTYTRFWTTNLFSSKSRHPKIANTVNVYWQISSFCKLKVFAIPNTNAIVKRFLNTNQTVVSWRLVMMAYACL